jgi:hypothetical protein
MLLNRGFSVKLSYQWSFKRRKKEGLRDLILQLWLLTRDRYWVGMTINGWKMDRGV